MTSLAELARAHTTLTPFQIAHLNRLVGEWVDVRVTRGFANTLRGERPDQSSPSAIAPNTTTM